MKYLGIVKRFFINMADVVKWLKKKKFIWIPATVIYWLMPAFYLLQLESFHFYPVFFVKTFLPSRLSVIMFDLILIYLLYIAGFFLIKKAWVNILLAGVLTTAVSMTNYIKYALTGDNFLPHDIIMAGNMNEIIGFVSVEFAWWIWAFIAAAVFSVIIPGLFAKDAPFKFYIRIPVTVIICTGIMIFFGNGSFAGTVFNKFKMFYEAASQQDSNYKENGFVGAFSINIASFSIQKPEGYSTSALETELNKYSEIPFSSDYQYPDIIVVLSESFWDPRLLPDSDITPNPLENFDKYSQSENAVSGKLIVPAFGGGTIRTEFEVLTGLSCDALPSGVIPYNIIKKSVPSYVSQYKNEGYDAIAIHPYLAKFYNRSKCLPLIGFDEYYAESLADIKEVERIEKGGYVSDESFAGYIKHFLNKANEPLFLFGISMENHQPYSYKYYYKTFTMRARNPNLTDKDHNSFENFTQGVQDADRALGEICDFIDKRERPTILVFFGDHLPSICTRYSSYLDTGFISDMTSYESRMKLYATPYIIYSNFTLNKDNSNYDIVASYDLLNVLSNLIGSGKTQYMGYLDALREKLPYYNVRLNKKITDEQKNFLKTQYFQTYKIMSK